VKRRTFITLLGGAASWPLTARAQQAGRPPTIGFLGANAAQMQTQLTEAFVRRLRELGWVEGRNVAIEYRWAEGRDDRAPALIAELVRLKVGVIVTHGSANVAAARQATSDIPIVFAATGDPVGLGQVASLARPGGNVTGLSLQSTDLAGKRLELLRDAIPDFRRVALLARAANPNEQRDVETASRALGLELVTPDIRRAEDIAPAIDSIKGRAQALYIQSDPMLFNNRVRIITLALGARLATMSGFREFVDAGGLMSYGPNFADMFRRAAEFVDKILHGAKPATIPVEQPTKFDLVVNQTAAKAIGLAVPASLLARADEVIE
jgi:putative ABC transport system substrate-binding protein